ncbi:hypothetical protein [Dactylosporangium sp. NPDC051541]|uniref:hypothetical protein n=1 Tax=Dactylosporangium sp. NPDC051541 TaxID=3363977 RepID=UPI0037B9A9BE
MTSRDEQRRKRRSDSFRRDEADEADDWLAGLRGGGRGEPDPFGPGSPDPRDLDDRRRDDREFEDRRFAGERPGSYDRPLERPDRMERSGTGERAVSFDRTTAIPIRRPAGDPRTGDIREPRTGDVREPRGGEVREPRTGDVRGRRARDDSPSGVYSTGDVRGRQPRDESPSGVFGPGALPPARPPARPANVDGWSTPDASTTSGGRRRRVEDDSPSGVYGRGAVANGRGADDSPSGVYRRADDSPSGIYGRGAVTPPPTARPPLDQQLSTPVAPVADTPGGGGRRRARDEEPHDQGPQLTPIIKPLTELAAPASTTEPPPLVPIFPNMRPDASPTSGAARRARRAAAEERAANPRTGDLGPRTGELGPRTGDLGPRTGDLGPRTGEVGLRTGDLGPRTGDVTGGRRRADVDGAEPGRNGGSGVYRGDTTMFRPGDRPRGGRTRSPHDDDPRAFESAAPPDTGRRDDIGRRDDSGVRRRDEIARRRPAYDDPPQQRRALDDDMPYDPYDEPSEVRRGRGGRGTGEYTGDYTSGGTRRPVRERPGRPDGDDPPGRGRDRDRELDRMEPPDRLDRPRTKRMVVDPVRTGPRPHRWIAMLSAIAVLVVLGACGVGTWFIFKDEKNGPDSAKSGQTSAPKKRDISSRDVDPKALTEAEVFPTNSIVAVPNEPPYVILATKASNDCKVAATEELANLLAGAGCTEVVRATMKSPNEEYLITAGVFNVTSEQVAAKTFDGIKPIVDGQKGRFAGMSVGAGTGTDALVRAPTQLGWNYKGHFITYCVIARVDGNNFAQGDPYPNQITYDIVETYLDNGIIENRSVVQPQATPAASLPPSKPS